MQFLKSYRIRIGCLSLVLLMVCSFLLLPGCGKKYNEVVYDKSSGQYVDGKSGSSYHALPTQIQPTSIGEQYAELKMDKTVYALYEIPGLDPLKYLSTLDGIVMTTEDVAVPELSSLRFDSAYLTTTGDTRITAGTISDANYLDALAACLSSEKRYESPFVAHSAMYILRLTLIDYPGLEYTVRYLEYDTDITAYDISTGEGTNVGRHLIYDIFAKVCYASPDLLSMTEAE